RSLGFAIALLLALGAPLSHSLWVPDEPVGAAVGSNMLRTGDFVVPRLNSQPFVEKPPLYWWVQIPAYRIFGVHDWVARIPSSLFMILTLGMAHAAGKRLEGARLALTALVVLGTMFQFNEDMQRAIVDPALVFFVFSAW